MFPRRPILALALLAACCFPLAASGMEKPWSTGPLRVSPNGRYLQTADGAPFFWIGDTAWRLFQRLTRRPKGTDWLNHNPPARRTPSPSISH